MVSCMDVLKVIFNRFKLCMYLHDYKFIIHKNLSFGIDFIILEEIWYC